MIMENRYPNRHKIELSKDGKNGHKGDLIITVWQEDGSSASNHQITKESFLEYLITHYRKEIAEKWFEETRK